MYFSKQIFKVAETLEWVGSRVQGKGYATPVSFEVKFASRFLIHAPSLFVDVGGNVGDYTFEIARRYPDCEIWLFEPAPANVQVLHTRFLGNPRIRVVPMGLSDQHGDLAFYSDAPGSGMASVHRRDVHLNDFTTRISVTRFEDFWISTLDRRPIDLMKMDIEGHELQALKGLGQALREIHLLQFEFGRCNLASRTTWAEFFRFFESAGFSLFRYSPLGLQPVRQYYETDEYFLHANFLAVNRDAKR